MKKALLALLCVVVFLLGISAPAFAANTNGSGSTVQAYYDLNSLIFNW